LKKKKKLSGKAAKLLRLRKEKQRKNFAHSSPLRFFICFYGCGAECVSAPLRVLLILFVRIGA
jgi:hypothetical protein